MSPGPLELIRGCLERLGRSGEAIRTYEILEGGASGSHIYRLSLGTEEAILKVGGADGEPWAVERARREAEFYRWLADSVPVRVPRVLGIHMDGELGICLLLARYQPCSPPEAWTESEYLQMSEQLGWLHAAFWAEERQLSRFRWLRVQQPGDTEADVGRAHGYWEALQREERFGTILSPRCCQVIQALMRRIEEIDAAIGSLPPTLCHGDCHVGNLLKAEDGSLIWADWQEVGIGRGPEDLSFLFQRATFQGATIPYSRITEAYRQSLEARLSRDVALSDVRRVMHGAELRTRLLYWPAYLQGASASALEEALDRIVHLAGSLGIATR